MVWQARHLLKVTPIPHKELLFYSHPIEDADERVFAEFIVYVPHRGWIYASRWHHWTMAEAIWWSPRFGVVEPRRFVDPTQSVKAPTC